MSKANGKAIRERWDWNRRHGIQPEKGPQFVFKDEAPELAKGLERMREEERLKQEERETYE